MALHPVFVESMAAAKRANRPALSAGTPQNARDLVDQSAGFLGPGPAVQDVRDVQVPTRSGDISARLFRPHPACEGLLVYFHGGGWVAGTVAGFDNLGRFIASHSGCAVLSVEYRLAPEHPFPCGLEDAEDAIRWAWANREELTGTQARLMVGGDSAGGSLALVSCLALSSDVPIALQVLFYPVADCEFGRPSYAEHGTGLPLTRDDMRWFFEQYAHPSQWNDPRISALKGTLSSAPRTWLGLARHDVLLSEGLLLGKELQKAGVPVQLQVYEDLTHGFARWFNHVDSVNGALRDACHVMRAAVERAGPA